MANSLNIDLEGKIVVLKKEALKPQFHDLKNRLFEVSGGFGSKPYTIGSALFGSFLSDGERARMEGDQVERLATEEEIRQ